MTRAEMEFEIAKIYLAGLCDLRTKQGMEDQKEPDIYTTVDGVADIGYDAANFAIEFMRDYEERTAELKKESEAENDTT